MVQLQPGGGGGVGGGVVACGLVGGAMVVATFSTKAYLLKLMSNIFKTAKAFLTAPAANPPNKNLPLRPLFPDPWYHPRNLQPCLDRNLGLAEYYALS